MKLLWTNSLISLRTRTLGSMLLPRSVIFFLSVETCQRENPPSVAVMISMMANPVMIRRPMVQLFIFF